MAKNTVAFGIFKTEMELTQAVDQLRLEGFRSEDISAFETFLLFLIPQHVGRRHLQNPSIVQENAIRAPFDPLLLQVLFAVLLKNS